MNEVNSKVAAWTEQFSAFKKENQHLVSDIKRAVEDHLDAVEDILDDCADDLKSALAAESANSAGDDAEAQELAISEAEGWVCDHVSNGSFEDRIAAVLWHAGPAAGEATLRKCIPSSSDTVTMRLTLDVTYALHGERPADVMATLQNRCELAIGDGMLTGDLRAVVDAHSMTVAIQPSALSEDEVAAFMLQRIENGCLALEDIPTRLVKYGLMDPQSFTAEMRERMATSEADQ